MTSARLILCSLFVAHSLFAQSAPSTDPAIRNYCVGVARGLQNANSFQTFCEWVASFDRHLPNLTGNQETRRFRVDGKDRNLIDTTGARVAYIEGRPHFSEVTINKVQVSASGDASQLLNLQGAWSYGDYGSDLRLLFGSHTNTHFSGGKPDVMNGKQVYVFEYDVPTGENHRWQMKAREKAGDPLLTIYPGYSGRILVDRGTGDLVRFERHTAELDKKFPLRYGSSEANYQRLPLGDGTTFVLPVASTVTFCHDDKHKKCEVNETNFRNWQKFGASSRIVTGEPSQ